MSGLDGILVALESIYSPQTTNEMRRDAQRVLDAAQNDPQAPFFGHQLALPNSISLPQQQSTYIVRHFGLNLLLHAITHNFNSWDMAKKLAVKSWVIDLATKVDPNDPHYIREKIAFLWVELTKRSWGQDLIPHLNSGAPLSPEELDLSWASMDSNLWELWNHSEITRDLSLVIQRTLYEDIYLLEDPIVVKRKAILNTLCTETVLSLDIISEKFNQCDLYRVFSGSNNGWLLTWRDTLDQALQSGSINVIIRILEIVKIVLYWIFPYAVRESNIIPKLFQCLKIDNVKIKILAIDALNTFYSKDFNSDEDFQWIKDTIFSNDIYSQLFNLFNTIQVDADDLTDESYTLAKRVAEFIITLTDYITSRTGIKTKTDDMTNFYNLVLEITKHQSPIISNICLPFWVSVLRLDELSDEPDFESIMPGLLEQAANRLINYADYDPNDPIMIYIENEFDNSTDRTSFLTSFKKYNDDILRIIICKKPKDGLSWLANRLNAFYSSSMGQQSLTSNTLIYKGGNSQTYHLSYAQFVIIEACVRGISRWLIWYKKPDAETIKQFLISQLDSLCQTLMQLKFQDPNLQRKKIQTLVQFSPLLKDSNDTMFKVLEIVIDACISPYPENATDEQLENVRDLRACSGTELNRMAYLIPDSLKNILTELEGVINNLINSGKVSPHELVGFKSFLLVVSQRSNIDSKQERFERIVDPELVSWNQDDTIKALSDLHWFMERLGIIRIRDYFQSRGITATTDLLSAEMDDEGKNLKMELKDKWTIAFPVRATRVLIQYSIEKLPHDSETYKYLLSMWKPRVQKILEYVLRLIYQIQAYHNPKNWGDLPLEVQTFVKYSTQERFWQEGISIQSKETFQEENVKAMHTLRDFADSLGHIIRYTREYGYMVIQSFTDLEETLYEIPNAATTLWKALTDERAGITLHSWRHMITTVVRPIIKNCPVKCIDVWMPEFLPLMLTTLDEVLVEKWSTVVIQNETQVDSDEQLSKDMLEEHMLRQLTQVIVRMLIDLVGQGVPASLNLNQIKMRQLISNSPMTIWGPLMRLMTHIMEFRDTRCTFNVILILRHLSTDIMNSGNTEMDEYIVKVIFQVLINILNDKFFTEAHSEAAYTLTLLYTGERVKSDMAMAIMQSYLNIPLEQLSEFEKDLASCTKSKEKRNLFMKLVQDANKMSTEDEEYGKARDKLLQSAVRRIKKKEEVDGLDNGGIMGLFGEQ